MLNIAHACVTDRVNGPGHRFTVWVQGCPRRCPGCFNPGLQAEDPCILVEPAVLARQALSDPAVAGLTLSGGEPFAQAAGLARFVDAVRCPRDGHPSWDVLAFTGYRIEELRSGPASWQDLLARLDLLVDGPYRESEHTTHLPLRGSANQRLLALSERGDRLLSAVERDRTPDLQVNISASGEILVSGFPPPGWMERLRNR